MASQSATYLRRNGKPQSCERCRKMKIKCDHATPTCGRCLKRNMPCLYDPAPLTKKFRAACFDQTESAKSRVPSIKKSATPTIFEPHSSSLHSDRSILPDEAVVIDAPQVKNAGFLGPISYYALMGGNQAPLNQLSGTLAAGDPVATHTIDPKRLELGLEVVEFLRNNAPLVQNLVKHLHYMGRMYIMPEKLTISALERLWDLIGDEYASADDSYRLQIVIRIFRNSYQPISLTKSSRMDELCHLISGENVRWETIGNMLIMSSLSLLHVHHRDIESVQPGIGDKQDLLTRFHKVIDSLSSLTNASPILNELVVSYKFNRILLLLQRFGDSSQYLYSSFVELTSCIYAAGIHRDLPFNGEYPGFLHQWRRRCFSLVYSFDKTFATVLGRPPQMNRHYCILEPPLDIDDGVFGLDAEDQIRCLDQNGWNTDGKRRSTTFIRLRFLLSSLREEILELHLGVNKFDVASKAQLVLKRLQSNWQACPNNMKYSSDMWQSSMSCQYILPLLWFYIDYQYSTFLIYRLTSPDPFRGSSAQILQVARNILSTILVINDERDRAREIRSDFTSVFLPYGLPCVEVLTMELLHRPSLSTHNSEYRFPRAEIIRDLTVYVSCLGWVARPGGGNFEFCKEVKAKLTRILDQIIDPMSNTVSTYTRETKLPTDTLPTVNQEVMDQINSWNHLFDWDAGLHWDSGLDLLCGPVL
ncbi:hypothetical protein BGW36DRAFT_328638 [Talaromyces proteolyticus]|uniref:Zn(2)-C6 fungal-type domain-containing protein n=1 Tax=Talaromyces proteolyticus TaxID=1131652 RepID=A0AAD4PSA1_9EURO|nr:uncharacterized protein BGW36DRAFT_328638 [Talaromyces proteolyticus]KAH8690727.1 hypothetical protein BGW36DRAFT_328638 [Talaromyces proteolyticus]